MLLSFYLITAGPTTSTHVAEKGSSPGQHSPGVTSPAVSGESGPALQCPMMGKASEACWRSHEGNTQVAILPTFLNIPTRQSVSIC